MATFPPEIVSDIAKRDEVELETTRRSGAKRKTIIWIVAEGSDVFVRSVRGEDGRWYQDLLAHPEGVLHFRGRPKLPSVPFRAFHTPDAESVARTSRALEAKYRGQGASLRSMLQEPVLPTTLRLEPL